MMEHQKILARMEEDIKLRGYSGSTQNYYLRYARKFLAFANRPTHELNESDVREYLIHLLNERGLSKGSINIHNAAICFLLEVTLNKSVNHKQIPRMREDKGLPEILTKDELHQIFEFATPFHNRVILMTIYGGGLRVSEACSLRTSDIDSSNMRIFVRKGKGNKDRYTLLSQSNLEILREYWKKYRPAHEDGWLFLNRAGSGHASVRTVQTAFNSALKRAGIEKEVTVHSLRASFATHLLEHGVDIFTVKRLIGHSGLGSLSRYMGVTSFEASLKSPLDTIHV